MSGISHEMQEIWLGIFALTHFLCDRSAHVT